MRTILCLGVLLLAAGSAAAQNRYQCRTSSGATYLSDRPCSGESGMVYYGPAPSSPTYTPAMPRLGEAPGHLRYMSARCSGLHDAIRTAPARGLKSDTLYTMQRDYQRECGEEEAEARTQFNRDQRDQRQQKVAERQSQAQAVERTKQQQAQCDESKRILAIKQRRTDLSDGEKADLKRFEENFKSRCS
ncbi:hypothetical protein [Ramlibacter albus]|nr:hypothetical protein [Ramlibacter albus]